MRIGLYTLFLYPGQIGGIETYVSQLVKALGQVDKTNEYLIFVSDHNQSLFTGLDRPNFRLVHLPLLPAANPLPLRALRRLKLIPVHLTQQLHRHPVDVLHYLGTTIDQREVKFPCVLTMHDIQQEYYPQFFPPETLAWRQANFQPSAHKARQIIADSAYTRQTIIEKYHISPEKIHTVRLGIDEQFKPIEVPPALAAIRHQHNLPEQFLFYPANPWPHKNHARLFEALIHLRRRYAINYPLVLSGVWSEPARLEAQIVEAGLTGQVQMLGYLPYKDLPALYAAATALIFPSLFEGFGMPVLEAMACGCPVICANTTSLPELAGESAILVDPLHVAQMAEAIYNIIHSASLRAELRQKGLTQVKNFSWTRTAQQTVEVYQQAIHG